MSKLNGHQISLTPKVLALARIDRVGMRTVAAVRKHSFDPRFHDVGRLIDALRRDGDEDVAEWYEWLLGRNDGLTRSCFIIALFEYIQQNDIVRKLDQTHEKNREERFANIAKRRKAGGKPQRTSRSKKRS
jgi:hypothetical protein